MYFFISCLTWAHLTIHSVIYNPNHFHSDIKPSQSNYEHAWKSSIWFKINQVKAKRFFLADYIHCCCISHNVHAGHHRHADVQLLSFFNLMYDVNVTHSVFLWLNLSSRDLYHINYSFKSIPGTSYGCQLQLNPGFECI